MEELEDDGSSKLIEQLTKDCPEKLPAVSKLVRDMRAKHEIYVGLLDSGTLGEQGFANAVNSSMTDLVRDVAELVGEEVTEEVYGVKPGEFVFMVDANLMRPVLDGTPLIEKFQAEED